jgi:hypothetical protein
MLVEAERFLVGEGAFVGVAHFRRRFLSLWER